MHSKITILALALATTLSSAIPHPGSHNHMARHLHPRTPGQSNNGECGGDLGFTCGPGYCCSMWGYCGASKEYCDAGCQSAFGVCNDNATTSITPTAGPTAVSTATGSGAGNKTTISVGGPSVSVIVDTTVTIQSTVSAGAPNTKAFSHPGWTGQPGRPTSAYSSASSSSVAVVSTSSVPAETSTSILSSSAASYTTLQTSYAPAPSSSSAPASTPVSVASISTSYSVVPVSSSSAASSTSSSAVAPSSYSAPSTSVAPSPTSYSATSSSTSSAPAATSSSSGSSSGSDSYKLYSGDGTTAAGWPSQDSWVDFESMWSANMALISVSCTQFSQTNNDDTESDDLKSAIQAVASSSGIDERFILAIVMQESKGCVRAPTTNYGVTNPGLMQSHDGAGTCNNAGTVQNPCPASEITQMITDGSTGTSSGDGLKQGIAQSGASDVSKYYKAARIYNSGSIASSGNLDDGIATHCYSSDIANRLTGWVKATTQCNLG